MLFRSTLFLLTASLSTIQASVVPLKNQNATLEPRGKDGEGISCTGSFLCKHYFPRNALVAIKGYIQGIDLDQHYLKDEFIACQDTICARLRKIEYPMKGWQVRDLMNVLGEYCGPNTACGTIPICAITNNPNTGCRGHLAVEWCGRTRPECDGLCARPAYVDAQDVSNHNGVTGDDIEDMKDRWESGVYNPDKSDDERPWNSESSDYSLVGV